MATSTTDKLSRRALLRGRPTSAGSKGLVVAASCLARQGVLCRTCADVCPEGAIRFPPLLGRVAQPMPDIVRCTGCGDCVSACPADALHLEPDHAA
jgi:ferredoxin-type protein NapF